jgi:hypothetical protein
MEKKKYLEDIKVSRKTIFIPPSMLEAQRKKIAEKRVQ